MINGEQILAAIALLEKEKQIRPEITIEALKEGLTKAYHRDVDPQATVIVDIDEKTGNIQVFNGKLVVDEITDDMTQLTLEEAQKLNKNYQVGDIHRVPVEFDTEFSRIATQQVAQTLKQKLKETEKSIVFDLYKDRIGDVVPAQVESEVGAGYILTINKIPAFLPKSQCIRDERIKLNDTIQVCITNVTLESKGAQILVSRTSIEFVRNLMITAVPEIREGLITIEWIERLAGKRAKIVVKSTDPSLDPIGTCVGKGGERTKGVEKYLAGEKIEIAKWSEDPMELLKSIFSPAPLISIEVLDELVNIITPDEKYSLALSNGGINVKIAASLLTKRIKVYKESEVETVGIKNLNNVGYEERPSRQTVQVEERATFDEPLTFDNEDKFEGDFEFEDIDNNDSEEEFDVVDTNEFTEFDDEKFEDFDSDDLYN